MCKKDKVNNAKDILKNDTFDMLMLDHDLGGEELVDSCKENTGYQLVKYIINNKLQKNAEFIIHSQNPVGSVLMNNTLKDNGYRCSITPFTLIYSKYACKKI